MVAFLAPLAIWILLSGLDDLFVALVWLISRRRAFPWPDESELDKAAERPIAILLPLWHEHRVIGQMLERNLASICYDSYQIFAGLYPNDEPTVRAVREIACRNPRVHIAMLSHDGPTSKGDCLNGTWLRMREYEAKHGIRFQIVMTHDAEDIIHPDSLRLVNWFSRDYQMVQIPVLALPTPWREFTHGIYCDEFAEFQQKDIPVRQRLGGFLPSNGVGTGFSREALDSLAVSRHGRAFDPECLTEDYENGFRIHELGYRQIFVPVRTGRHIEAPVATREYFPRRLRPAVRQRSRWVAGITLQGWQHHGWRAPWQQIYWLWRDRKGLPANLLSPVVNLLFLLGVANPRALTECPPWLAACSAACLVISSIQLTVRMWCSAQVYGWRFAAGVPVRMWWANAVNALATVDAIRQFVAARRRKVRLGWRKTEHFYPAHSSTATGRQRLGEVLVRMRRLSFADLNDALRNRPDGTLLGEYLIKNHGVSEENLYHALSLHAGVELGMPNNEEVSLKASRMLPLDAVRRWRVIPYRIDLGQIHLLTPNVPNEEMTVDLANYCVLELRFRLVFPSEFDRLFGQLYGERVTVPLAPRL